MWFRAKPEWFFDGCAVGFLLVGMAEQSLPSSFTSLHGRLHGSISTV